MEGVVLNAMVRSIRWPRTVIYQVVKNLFDVPTAAAVIDGSFLSTAEAILWESLGFSSMIDLGMYTFDSLWRYGSRMSTALELEFCSASQTTHHVERCNQYSKYWRLSEELDSFGNYLPPDYIPRQLPALRKLPLYPALNTENPFLVISEH
ncbi:hypothetical protein Bca52824_064360 [Brassica carinata]|uniref:Uncharacterized protein n=1 Tax=Brassica carinata TaxID=52824 RepID=A0A8X7U827_BRACI|nr:hypothetical protein Bca52824_064360 [Brassica carinata]